VSIVIRSAVFNVLFYMNLVAHLIVGLPTLVMTRHAVIALATSWARTNIWLLRVICRIDVVFTGCEKIPAGPLIVAAKHQSLLETFALIPLFDDPLFIVKRELMWIPLFGWYIWKADMIFVDRGARATALLAMTEAAGVEIRRGRQLIIFPEGTRRAAGVEPVYKFGVVHLYAAAGVPCVPVALNSGVAWPRRSFIRYPGTVSIEILDPIAPNLDKQTFFARMRDSIESVMARLIPPAKQHPDA
jgi:1-acyl-sn-glycerol-3-phosphate acyltransferase